MRELTRIVVCIVDGSGVEDCGDGKYCCYGSDGCDCSNQTTLFTLDPGNIITTLPVEIPSATSTSSFSQSTSKSTPGGSTSGAKSGPSGLSSSASIGVGVGVGIAALLLIGAVGVGVVFWIRRRRRARESRAHVDTRAYYRYEGMPAGQQEFPLAEKDGLSRVEVHDHPHLLDSRSRSELQGSSLQR